LAIHSFSRQNGRACSANYIVANTNKKICELANQMMLQGILTEKDSTSIQCKHNEHWQLTHIASEMAKLTMPPNGSKTLNKKFVN
jgi:Tat protein secretion system quality control protein TatD with DNase activity